MIMLLFATGCTWISFFIGALTWWYWKKFISGIDKAFLDTAQTGRSFLKILL